MAIYDLLHCLHRPQSQNSDLSRCIITQDLICSLDNQAARRGEIFLSITYRFVPMHPSSPVGSNIPNLLGSISPTSSSSGSSRSSPLSGSPQSTVHAQLPSYSYHGSGGGNYNYQQAHYGGGYDGGYTHQLPQLSAHSPSMGTLVSILLFSS